ncbi:MAG: hypothetical protein R3C11_08605 [Planctomycetaceae bacterium]
MKRKLANLFIASYLAVMSFGLFSHTMEFMHGSHPAMYFIIWDMFCGWSAYENRIHIVGEGESGAYYDLSQGPWGEFNPYSDIGRRHYDYRGVNLKNISDNVLAHTEHEPMTRIFIFEENWSKKYNMPDFVWKRLYDEPKELRSYFAVRQVLTPESQVAQSNPCWLTRCAQTQFADNPRLQREAQSSNPYLSIATSNRKSSRKTDQSSADEAPLFTEQQEPDDLFSPAGN